jgi:PAS domain S-box-containing protein
MEGFDEKVNYHKIVAEHAADWLMYLDLNRKVRYVSPSVEEITGYTPEEFMEDEDLFKNLIVLGDKQPVMDTIASPMRSDQSCSKTFQIKHKDGSLRWIAHRCHPVFNNNQQVVGRVSSNQDITRQKDLEVSLAAEKAFLQTIIDGIQDPMHVVDKHLKIVLTNKKLLDLKGVTMDEIKGRQCYEVYQQRDTICEDCAAQKAFETGNSHMVFKSLPTAGGKKKYFEVYAYPIKNEAGNVEQVIELTRDVTEQKNTQDALKVNEERLLTLINSTPDIIFFKDGEGRWQVANNAGLELFSLKGVDYQGKTDVQLAEETDPVYRKSFLTCKETDEAAWKASQISRQEEAIEKPDGDTKIYDVIKSPIFNADGSRNGIVVLGRDITENKKIENNLRISEQKYKSLIQNAPSGIILIDDKEQIFFCNQQFGRILGYSQQEISGKNFKIFLDKEDVDLVATRYKMRQQGKNVPQRYEFSAIHKSGRRLRLEITSVVLKDEKDQPFTMVFLRDISNKWRYENIRNVLLEISRMAFTQSTLHDYLASVRKSLGKILNVTNFYVALYDEVSDTYSFAFHEDETESYELNKPVKLKGSLTDLVRLTGKGQLVNAQTEPELQKQYDIKLVGTPGTVWLGAPLMCQDAVIGVVAVQDYHNEQAYDKSDLETLELIAANTGLFVDRVHNIENLQRAKEKAEESDRLKTAFLLNMSHEIRTPMNGIMGFADLLDDTDASIEEQQEYIRNIKKSGSRMLSTINDLVDIAKIEANQVALNYSAVSVKKLLGELYELFQQEATQKGLQLIWQQQGASDAVIKTDEDKLYSILSNLLKNAIKFTKAGKVVFGAKIREKEIGFFVTDTGIGIPPELRETIFNRFEQAEMSRQRAFQGLGLGLSIAKPYAEIMKGRIEVDSEVNRGTTFTAWFPLLVD